MDEKFINLRISKKSLNLLLELANKEIGSLNKLGYNNEQYDHYYNDLLLAWKEGSELGVL